MRLKYLNYVGAANKNFLNLLVNVIYKYLNKFNNLRINSRINIG